MINENRSTSIFEEKGNQMSGLIFDTTIFIYSLGAVFLFDQSQLIDNLGKTNQILIFILIAFLLPWYIGMNHTSIIRTFPKTDKLLLIIYGIVTLFLFTFPVTVTPFTSKDLNFIDNLVLLDFSAIFFGAMLGFYAHTSHSIGVKDSIEDHKGMELIFMLFTIVIFMLFSYKYCSMIEGSFLSIMAVILAFVVSVVFAGVLLSSIKGIAKLVNSTKAKDFLTGTFDKVVLPFLLASALIFWNAFGLKVITGWIGSKNGFTVLLSMFLSGFIPLRMVMMLRPPFNFTNLAVGIASLMIYCISLL